VNGWRLMFAVAAAFNAAVGLAMLFAPAAISGGSVASDPALLVARTAALLILTYAIGYAMVAWAPRDHRGIVILGVIGKLSLVALVAWMAAMGEVPMATVVLVSGDLLFAAAFIVFLRRVRPLPRF
jgi:predicted acyltransferase